MRNSMVAVILLGLIFPAHAADIQFKVGQTFQDIIHWQKTGEKCPFLYRKVNGLRLLLEIATPADLLKEPPNRIAERSSWMSI